MQVVGKMNAGGVKAVVMEYYRHIDRNKIQFDFIVDEDSKDIAWEEIESLGGRVFVVPRYERIFSYIKELYLLFRKEKVDIVHCRINTLNVFPLMAAWAARVPVRIAENLTTSHPDEKKTILKKLLRPFQALFATNCMACSKHCAEWMYGKNYKKKVEIVPTAYDTKKYAYQYERREAVREALGIRGKTVFGNIGRMTFQKNQLFLLDIFSEIKKKNKNAVLLLIGDGELRPLIEKKIEALKLENEVILTGTKSEVADYYQAMDCFLFPSKYEGLGIVVVQAQNSGLPCVVSTEVPSEANITGQVKYLKLSDNKNVWAQKALEEVEFSKREDQTEKLNKAGYDIVEASRKLSDFYLNLKSLGRDGI